MAYTYCFTIHGTRGSFPVCGKQFLRHGGQTTCFSLRAPAGLLVFDAGTGMGDAGKPLRGAPTLPTTIFFTHFHLDHVIGLPAFTPLYDPRAKINFMADARRYPRWRAALRRLAGRPYWPVDLEKCGGCLRWRDLPAAGRLSLYGVNISWCPVRHPQPCLAYRLDTPARSIVIATDYEPGDAAGDAQFLQFCRQADVLIFDAQFTPREYPRYRGWGHGVWTQGVRIARAAGIRQLILTHHAPGRTDRQIDAIARAARQVFPGARAAYDGMTWRWQA